MAETRWRYTARDLPKVGGDARKLVTLEEDGMRWVGIRAFHPDTEIWYNGNDPERAAVIAWRDLDEPARGRWHRGQLLGAES